MTPRPEDPCRDPASEMRDDHFDPDDHEKRRLGVLAEFRVRIQALLEQDPPCMWPPPDPDNLEGCPPTPEERAATWRELNRIAPTPADKMALMMSFQNEQEPPSREAHLSTLKPVVVELKSQCNRYANGVCQNYGCLARGGYERGTAPDYNTATCEKHEQLTALESLIPELFIQPTP